MCPNIARLDGLTLKGCASKHLPPRWLTGYSRQYRHHVNRAQEISTLQAIHVTEMEEEEAKTLFCKYAKLNPEAADITEEVLRIVKELGYLALAITLVGSYVTRP